jgi:hypothetical protein
MAIPNVARAVDHPRFDFVPAFLLLTACLDARFFAALFVFFLATVRMISRLVIGTLVSLWVDFLATDFFAMVLAPMIWNDCSLPPYTEVKSF